MVESQALNDSSFGRILVAVERMLRNRGMGRKGPTCFAKFESQPIEGRHARVRIGRGSNAEGFESHGIMQVLTIANSPHNKGPTKLIESARNELVKGI